MTMDVVLCQVACLPEGKSNATMFLLVALGIRLARLWMWFSARWHDCVEARMMSPDFTRSILRWTLPKHLPTMDVARPD